MYKIDLTEALRIYQAFRTQITALRAKIGEIEADRQRHRTREVLLNILENGTQINQIKAAKLDPLSLMDSSVRQAS